MGIIAKYYRDLNERKFVKKRLTFLNKALVKKDIFEDVLYENLMNLFGCGNSFFIIRKCKVEL